MGTPAKTYPIGKTIAAGLALAVVFSVLSLFFLFMQARDTQIHLSGEVVAVAAQSVTIRNARGTDTILAFAPDARLHGVASVAAIVPGQHVMIKGTFNEADIFEVERLRVVGETDNK